MTPISPLTQLLVQKIFPNKSGEVKLLLEKQCGQNLPLCDNATSESLQRLHFAALKVSAGKIDVFFKAIDLAKSDWRDLLVWAEFADDLEAHMKWANQILKP